MPLRNPHGACGLGRAAAGSGSGGWIPAERLRPICGQGDNFGLAFWGPAHREPTRSFDYIHDSSTTMASNFHPDHVRTTEEDDLLRQSMRRLRTVTLRRRKRCPSAP